MSKKFTPVKLVVVGDTFVGKTSILLRYTQNKFQEYQPTIFDNSSTIIQIDNKVINLGLWDTAGQQQYNRIRPLAYPKCDVALICFSVVDSRSFTNAKRKWYFQLEQCIPQTIKIFVGNKIDLREQSKQLRSTHYQNIITKEDGITAFQNQIKCRYLECSAKTQQGLKQLFEEAVRMVIAKRKLQGWQHCSCSLI